LGIIFECTVGTDIAARALIQGPPVEDSEMMHRDNIADNFLPLYITFIGGVLCVSAAALAGVAMTGLYHVFL
jgi:hypothetical protein